MSQERKIAGLEFQLKSAKAQVAHAADIRKLIENKLFRSVILEGFVIHEAARYLQEAGDPLCSEVQRADALALAMAGGHLKRWIAVTLQMADSAEGSIAGLEEEIELTRAQSEYDDDQE